MGEKLKEISVKFFSFKEWFCDLLFHPKKRDYYIVIAVLLVFSSLVVLFSKTMTIANLPYMFTASTAFIAVWIAINKFAIDEESFSAKSIFVYFAMLDTKTGGGHVTVVFHIYNRSDFDVILDEVKVNSKVTGFSVSNDEEWSVDYFRIDSIFTYQNLYILPKQRAKLNLLVPEQEYVNLIEENKNIKFGSLEFQTPKEENVLSKELIIPVSSEFRKLSKTVKVESVS